MIIENETPIVKAATEEVVFDGFWASRVIIDTPSPSSLGSVLIELKPLNSSTGEVLNTIERITVPNIWEAAQDIPEVAQAVNSLIAAVDKVRKKKLIDDAAKAAASAATRLKNQQTQQKLEQEIAKAQLVASQP